MKWLTIYAGSCILGRVGGERLFEQLALFFQNYGYLGLFIVSFTESFISPILPDLLLIPMALAAPEKAIYYGLVATAASVIGGILGYYIGHRFGLPVVKRFVPEKHTETIRNWVNTYGGWAIVAAALAPIPYKFVSICAGMFRVNTTIFILASIVGRGKRFLIEGILIYYYGPLAVELMTKYSDEAIIVTGVVLVILWGAFKLLRSFRRQPSTE